MRAVDTSIIIRFITADDEEQFARAKHTIEMGDVFVATTVLLECEWVLRKAYRYQTVDIVSALRDLAGTDGVHVQDLLLLARALEWTDAGLEFADALHLASSTGCADFVTFDRPLARRAAALGIMPVLEP